MPTDISKPDPALVLDLLEAFRRSKVMFAAVSLGVFDALAAGPHSVTALTGKLNCAADSLERFLDACVGLQLLQRNGELYSNTPVANAYLTQTSPHRLTGYIGYSNRFGWKLWGNLEDSVREGTHRWKQSYGWEGPIFSNFFANEEAKREFLMGMHGFGMISSPQVVNAFDLSGFKHFVDLGGATGHLVMAACDRYAALRGTVFDLPEALPLAREIVGASPGADRIDLVGGDFFGDRLPPGDVYALGRILHDWTEAKILKLLTRVFESLPSGGALLIAEKLIWEDRTGPRWGQMQDLNMLVCTEGRERTLTGYDTVLKKVGFDNVTGCRLSGPLDAVLARKS